MAVGTSNSADANRVAAANAHSGAVGFLTSGAGLALLGVGLVVWSPLAMGLLTGKYDEGKPEGARLTENENWSKNFLTDENIQKVRDLKPIADDLGITRAQLALAWILRQPGVSSVITGATKVSQIEDTVKAAGVRLSEDVNSKIEAVLTR